MHAATCIHVDSEFIFEPNSCHMVYTLSYMEADSLASIARVTSLVKYLHSETTKLSVQVVKFLYMG